MNTGRLPIPVGLLGAGGVAACVAEKAAALEHVRLVGFATRPDSPGEDFARKFQLPRLTQAELVDRTSIIIEAANPAALSALVPIALERGRTVIAMSINGLIAEPGLVALAISSPGRLVLASGAIAGLDALVAARHSGIRAVKLKTRKPPGAFCMDDSSGAAEPVCIFSGTARQAGAQFPKNTNVAASLALAAFGAAEGPDLVQVEIWSDPTLATNIHEIEFESGAGTVRTTVCNRAVPGNPATSQLAANSAVAALEKLTSSCTFA